MTAKALAPGAFALVAALAAIAGSAAGQEQPGSRVVIDASSSGPSVAERFATIQQRVREAVTYPPIARLREVTGESQIEFEIDREGNPFDVVTIESSGNDVLDRAAMRAVEKAAPLPWIHGRIIVPVRFQLDDES